MAWGLACGTGGALLLTLIVQRAAFFSRLHARILEILGMVDVGGLNPVWISLCAGLGEESLFRGALQPLLGIWWTSLLFAVLHIQPADYRKPQRGTLYYIALIVPVSLMVGTIFNQLGLLAAMATHASWDLIVILLLRAELRRRAQAQEPG